MVWERFGIPDPLAWRREFAASSFHMIAAHPWFGVGLGAWPTVYPSYAIADFGVFANQAHSDWLEWVVEGGVGFAVARGPIETNQRSLELRVRTVLRANRALECVFVLTSKHVF